MVRAHLFRLRWGQWLIAIALVLRALVPAGWMTAAAAGGGITLIPCTGVTSTPQAAHPPAHGGHHEAASAHVGHYDRDGQQQDHDGKTQQPCAFAGLALAWAPAAPPPLLAPVQVDPLLARPKQLRITGRGLAAPPPPSTGPPVA